MWDGIEPWENRNQLHPLVTYKLGLNVADKETVGALVWSIRTIGHRSPEIHTSLRKLSYVDQTLDVSHRLHVP